MSKSVLHVLEDVLVSGPSHPLSPRLLQVVLAALLTVEGWHEEALAVIDGALASQERWLNLTDGWGKFVRADQGFAGVRREVFW